MNELKVIEQQGMIKIYETDKGEKVVNGRELHEGLDSKQDFSTWIKKRIEECDAVENEDFLSLHKKMEREIGATTRKEYLLKLDIAKEMAMLERNEKGKEYRRYFIEIEKKYKQNLPPLSKELQAIFIIDRRQQEFNERLTTLENTTTIDYAQQLALTTITNKKAISVMGGMESPCYKDKSIRSKVFASIWRDYKGYFMVNSYKNTAKKEFDKAKEYLNNWQPQGRILREIEESNLQMAIA